MLPLSCAIIALLVPPPACRHPPARMLAAPTIPSALTSALRTNGIDELNPLQTAAIDAGRRERSAVARGGALISERLAGSSTRQMCIVSVAAAGRGRRLGSRVGGGDVQRRYRVDCRVRAAAVSVGREGWHAVVRGSITTGGELAGFMVSRGRVSWRVGAAAIRSFGRGVAVSCGERHVEEK